MNKAAYLALLISIGCGGEPTSMPDDTEPSALREGNVGVFLFRSMRDGQPSFQSALTASFATDQKEDLCSEVVDISCVRRECSYANHGGEDAAPIDAGRITATSDGKELSVQPGEAGPYPARLEPIALWEHGRMIDIRASGGDVPSFDVQIVGPDHAKLAIELPDDTILSLSREKPMLLSWNGSGVGQLVSIISYQHEHDYGTITCRFPASDGGGLIPDALTRDFNPNGAEMRFNVGVGTSAIVQSGNWDIEVIAYTNAITEDGGDASFSAQFAE